MYLNLFFQNSKPLPNLNLFIQNSIPPANLNLFIQNSKLVLGSLNFTFSSQTLTNNP